MNGKRAENVGVLCRTAHSDRKTMDRTGKVAAGIVTARKCPHCGHHELGIVGEDGIFHALSPGMRVQVLGKYENESQTEPDLPPIRPADSHNESAPSGSLPWAPETILDNPVLRKKYGVMLPPEGGHAPPTPSEYRAAYLGKLTGLLAKEDYPWVAVLLDQYLKAAHLAYGEARETADALWRELEEIRKPAERVEAWLENPDQEKEKALLDGCSKSEFRGITLASAGSFSAELASLSLEEFLSSL